MTVTLKNIRVKADIEFGTDQAFDLEITGENFPDIGAQAVAFAKTIESDLKARNIEVTVGNTVVKDVGRFFRASDQNPYSGKNSSVRLD